MSEFGLRYTQIAHVIARGDKLVLKGGLGALGVGTMWVTVDPRDTPEILYDDVPYDPDRRDGFGETERDVLARRSA